MSSVSELCANYIALKAKAKSLENEIETSRQAILRVLDEKNLDQLSVPGYTVNKKVVRQKRISKDLLPPDIYDQYAKQTVMTQLEVLTEEKVEQRRNRLTRSPARLFKRSPARANVRKPT